MTDEESADARLAAIAERLKGLKQQSPGLGYAATALYRPGDFDEEDIEREVVDEVTGGKLPVIHLNLTYDLDVFGPGGEMEQALLRDFSFQHVLTDPAF